MIKSCNLQIIIDFKCEGGEKEKASEKSDAFG